jgi:hypothetical protein
MQNINMDNTSDHTIWSFLKKYADIIGAIVFGIGIGASLGAFFINNEKSKLFSDNQSLIAQIRSLQGFVKADSVNNENWLNNHIHKISLNMLSNDQPIFTAVDYLSKKKSTKALVISAGDSLSFKVFYHNTGNFAIYNPSIGFGILPISKDTLEAVEVLIVGNQVVDTKNIKLNVSPANRQYFYPLLKSFFLNNKLVNLDPTSHEYDYGFPIQTIKPGETFSSTYNFILKITKH